MNDDHEDYEVCVKKNNVLQGNRRKRRKSQGGVLWNMSHRPAHDQE